jgi:hypothetical protein
MVDFTGYEGSWGTSLNPPPPRIFWGGGGDLLCKTVKTIAEKAIYLLFGGLTDT